MPEIEQQSGVSPAMAGGPSTKDRFRTGNHNPGHVYDGNTEIGFGYTPDWGRRIVKGLNLLDAYEAGSDPRDAEIERLRGELAAIHEALGPWHGCRSLGDTDLEVITNLRAALAAGARGLNRQAARANSAEAGIEHWQGVAETRGAQVENFAAEISELTAERDRLRDELGRIRNLALTGVNRLPEEDRRPTVDLIRDILTRWRSEQQNLLNEMDESRTADALLADARTAHDVAARERDDAREEWKRADAEVTRLREKLGIPSETALRGLADQLHAAEDNGRCGLPEVTIDHVRTLINCVASTSAEYRAECTRLGAENTTVKAELDRLSAELDGLPQVYGRLVNQIIEAQREDTRVEVATLDQLAGELDQLIETLKAENGTRILFQRQRDEAGEERDVIANGLVAIQRDITAVNIALGKLKKPAEPRRWVAGDPEPEIGTTITWGAGKSHWKRYDDGWKNGSCSCKQCSSMRGLTWDELLAYAPLIEVVSTDGH